jgi:hypothetical protein
MDSSWVCNNGITELRDNPLEVGVPAFSQSKYVVAWKLSIDTTAEIASDLSRGLHEDREVGSCCSYERDPRWDASLKELFK